jgi:PhnO protein
MIRKANLSDLIEIHKLIEELESKSFDFNLLSSVFHENFVNPNIHYYVAEIDKNIIGFMSLYESLPLHHCEKIIEINELIVSQRFRSQHIGKELIAFAKVFASENNCRQIELSSNMQRLRAHSFYLRNGFKRGHFKFVSKF